MTDKPKDFDIWAAFIKLLDSKSSVHKQQPRPHVQDHFKSTAEDSDVAMNMEWASFTDKVDMVNHKRSTYIQKCAPILLKQKQATLDSYPNHHFMLQGQSIEHTVNDLDRIDRNQLKKMSLHYIAVVDLHGYTLPLAYERLKTAFQAARLKKIRILKVITGKGRPNPEPETPTLRRIFPKWMQEPEFYSKLTKLRKAPFEHGGEGAFLVYLKKIK